MPQFKETVVPQRCPQFAIAEEVKPDRLQIEPERKQAAA
jgi:hypothetical protein